MLIEHEELVTWSFGEHEDRTRTARRTNKKPIPMFDLLQAEKILLFILFLLISNGRTGDLEFRRTGDFKFSMNIHNLSPFVIGITEY
jgi:hypothetical protein